MNTNTDFDAFWEMRERALPTDNPKALARAVWEHCEQRAEHAEPARCADLETVIGVLTDLYNELGCEHDNEAGLRAIAQLRANLAAARELLEECAEALELSYDATEWPADGTSRQEAAAKKARAALSTQSETQC